jgi:hypothetical protein
MNPTPITITSPVLADVALAQLQVILEANLSWLTTAYGKIEKRVFQDPESRPVVFPAIFCGEKEYLNLLPDEHLGNYSYVEVLDSQEVVWRPRQTPDFKADIALVFWFDFRTVYPSDHNTRTVEHVKADVLDALNVSMPGLRITVNSISERAENIYRGFSASEIQHQFLMRPYGGFRVDANIFYKSAC